MDDCKTIYGWYGEPNDPAVYTVGERKKFFNAEGGQWRDWFFKTLEKEGQVRTNFAIYTTENKTPFE